MKQILDSKKVINLGLKSFYESLKEQGADVVHVDWRPRAGGKPQMIKCLDGLQNVREKIDKANLEAVRRLNESHPVLVDVRPASEVVPGMKKNLILHAGPPVSWERMCGPVRGAVTGALIYEGLASSVEEAENLAASGKIEFAPCHHHSTVGPMAGVVSYSMWVFCVENRSKGNRAYCTLNEGLGKVLRFGANTPDVIERLKWMERVLAPSLHQALMRGDGIDIRSITSQALQMGDECHNRNVAATNILLKELTPLLFGCGLLMETIDAVFKFISDNPHFFLNLSMAACKASCDTITGIEYSTVLSAMARNGTELGIRVAGLGDEWFTAPAGMPKGLYFAGYSEKDSNPDLGDSTISETAGIGAAAMASAPAIVKFVGGTPNEAIEYTKKMYRITAGTHNFYQIPVLNFKGTPLGIDIEKVVAGQITPFINTGIAHKEPGIGQVGAGLLWAPMECFEAALKRFCCKYNL